MFSQIAKLFKNAQQLDSGQEPLQTNHAANASAEEAKIVWQPLDTSKLSITSDRLQQIEAGMAEKARAEFAAVTSEFNRSQEKASQD